MVVWCRQKNLSLGITISHHSAKPCDAKQWPSEEFLSEPYTQILMCHARLPFSIKLKILERKYYYSYCPDCNLPWQTHRACLCVCMCVCVGGGGADPARGWADPARGVRANPAGLEGRSSQRGSRLSQMGVGGWGEWPSQRGRGWGGGRPSQRGGRQTQPEGVELGLEKPVILVEFERCSTPLLYTHNGAILTGVRLFA